MEIPSKTVFPILYKLVHCSFKLQSNVMNGIRKRGWPALERTPFMLVLNEIYSKIVCSIFVLKIVTFYYEISSNPIVPNA